MEKLIEVRRSSREILRKGSGEIFMIAPIAVLAAVFDLTQSVAEDLTLQLEESEPDQYIRFGVSDLNPFPGYYETRYAKEYGEETL
jgi:hypothetical protein